MASNAGRSALIVWGGWDGHEPQQVAEIFHKELSQKGFRVDVSDTLDAYKDRDLTQYTLIVPVWTMGTITQAQLNPLVEAVKGGVGLAGCHGGMCDSFRNETEYQFMTGGQWVAHPGNDGTEYTVRITDPNHFITQGSVPEFKVVSEQYYMHVDPANKTLAVTRFPVADGPHVTNGEFDMPVIWTKMYGQGRVAYNSLGHHADIVAQKEVLPLMVRGALWAARAEDAA
ncbi:MAG: ThuA domain-containing protein [Armatimonadetes bacterium]|nr:ThuA domain-containing protein [Armatimonadota bacterium]